jgi:alpha/beta superfamily hydrolase
VQDLLAVVSYLADHGAPSIHLAGYSFGAWIALKAIHEGLQAGSLILVSPPLDHLSFRGLALPPKPSLITLGDRDGFCAVSSLMDWLASQPSVEVFTDVKLLSGCDHFYRKYEETLSLHVAELLESRFRPNAS